MSREEVEKKLVELGKKILSEIEAGKNPSIEIPIRSLSNIVFDEKTKLLKLGDKTAKRYFFNVAQAKSFMQTLLVASFCRNIIRENIHTSIRDMYYNLKRTLPNSDENTFDEQAESDPIIVDLETSLGVLREQLHLIADRKGVVAGNVVIEDRGDEIDWSKLGSGGWSIPSAVEDIKFKKVKADFVLCVPSDERIVARINGCIQILEAKELYQKYLERNDISLIGFDEQLRPKMQKMVMMHKRHSEPNEKLVAITTFSGSRVKVSENHKIPVLTESGIEIKLAKEVKEGDYLLEAKNLENIEVKDYAILDVVEFLVKKYPEMLSKIYVTGEAVKEVLKDVKAEYWINSEGDFYQEKVHQWRKNLSMPLVYYLKFEKDKKLRKGIKLYFKGSPKSKAIPALIRFDPMLSRILGYYAARGCLYNHIPVFTFGKPEEKYWFDVMSLMKKVFGIKGRMYKKDEKYSSVQIYFGNKVIGLLFEHFCGNTAYDKKVPEILYSLSKLCKLSFLEGYINGDGSRSNSWIRVYTVSEKLADDVRLLLRFIGIPSYKRFFKNNGLRSKIYVVEINTKHWNFKGSKTRWDKLPLFVFDENTVKRYLGYESAVWKGQMLKSNISFEFIHPIAVKSVEFVDYEGEYYEIISALPDHTFMHASGIFTHNCIEKNAGFERLHEDKFWKKYNCILIGTGGQPARGTRRLIKRLAVEHNLPIYVMTDSDSYGWYIYSVIKSGSMTLAHASDELGTPSVKFIGLTISDIEKYGLEKSTIKATEQDLKRAKELLQYPWLDHKEWKREIKLMLQKKIKAEIEALSSRGLKFLSEVYLPEKLEKQEFLP
jgi:DNA topoisomerase VI subunit A/intein/homing endonuclease